VVHALSTNPMRTVSLPRKLSTKHISTHACKPPKERSASTRPSSLALRYGLSLLFTPPCKALVGGLLSFLLFCFLCCCCCWWLLCVCCCVVVMLQLLTVRM